MAYTFHDDYKMVGLRDDFMRLRDLLIERGSSRREVIAVVGMIGIGKTLLTHNVFNDKCIQFHFHVRIWVNVTEEYRFIDILLDLLSHVRLIDKEEMRRKYSERQLAEMVHESLRFCRYLIVLDDIWDHQVWHDFRRLLPDEGNRGRIMVTGRLVQAAVRGCSNERFVHRVRLLDENESWDLLRRKVFGEKSISFSLEKLGRKIAESFQGLPLAIIAASAFLSEEKMEKLRESLAESENSTRVYSQFIKSLMSSVGLSLSAKQLPQRLRPCFLYMSIFPLRYGIHASRLMELWIGEGFLTPTQSETVEEIAEEYLDELVDRSLVLVHEQSSRPGRIKSCSLHSVYWHLCVSEAEKDTLFRVVDAYGDWAALEGGDGENRLCIRNNTLLGIKDIQNSSISTVRSLLCTGPNHPYPMAPARFLCFLSLKVLNAMTIRFYKFPDEILKLVELRYLAFTLNSGELPASVPDKLKHLECLVVHRHLSMTPPSHLPMEIWDMQELKHLQFMGNDLQHPSDEKAFLPNLLVLSDVSARSCTEGILRRIPNLKKLGIQIELTLDDAIGNIHVFDDLACVHQLKSLKCIVTNPRPNDQVILMPQKNPIFPTSLRKLTLSGCGFPWETMGQISNSMGNLEVLKLRCFAFRGPVWELDESEIFHKLEFLLLEDIDFESWMAGYRSFPRLKKLVIKHCYKLEKLPWESGDSPGPLEMIELVDCRPSVIDSAKEIQESHGSVQVHVHLSKDDKKGHRVVDHHSFG